MKADILFKQASFNNFANAFNYLHTETSFDRKELDAKRLADAFFAFHLVAFLFDTNQSPLTRIFLIYV